MHEADTPAAFPEHDEGSTASSSRNTSTVDTTLTTVEANTQLANNKDRVTEGIRSELVHHFEPSERIRWPYLLLFAPASLVVGVCNVTIKQLLLPAHVSILDPTNTVTTFAIVASLGALAGVIISPLVGAFSDRTSLRWGRRFPYLVIGLILAVVGLVLMEQTTTIAQLAIGEILVQVGVDTIMAMMTVLIADQIPRQQKRLRSLTAAFVGMSPIVGGLVGLLVVARFVPNVIVNPQRGYWVLLITTCVMTLPFLFLLRDRPFPKELVPAWNWKTFLAGFWVSPKRYPDFGFVWLSRALVFLGYTILISYFLYYLQQVVKHPEADQGLTQFQLIAGVCLILSAIGGGILANRLGRLKPFVASGAGVMMVALGLIAFVPVWNVLLVAAVLLGTGFGTYLAVDILLSLQVLPTTSSRGKDLGLIHTAIFLPLILSAPLGAIILNTFQNYSVLFGIAACCFLAATLLILPIKQAQ